jgi:hypothetical protein
MKHYLVLIAYNKGFFSNQKPLRGFCRVSLVINDRSRELQKVLNVSLGRTSEPLSVPAQTVAGWDLARPSRRRGPCWPGTACEGRDRSRQMEESSPVSGYCTQSEVNFIYRV